MRNIYQNDVEEMTVDISTEESTVPPIVKSGKPFIFVESNKVGTYIHTRRSSGVLEAVPINSSMTVESQEISNDDEPKEADTSENFKSYLSITNKTIYKNNIHGSIVSINKDIAKIKLYLQDITLDLVMPATDFINKGIVKENQYFNFIAKAQSGGGTLVEIQEFNAPPNFELMEFWEKFKDVFYEDDDCKTIDEKLC